jgi:hypothetical protein
MAFDVHRVTLMEGVGLYVFWCVTSIKIALGQGMTMEQIPPPFVPDVSALVSSEPLGKG